MGRVSVPYGVQGWIRIQAYSGSLDGLAAYPVWWLGKNEEFREFSLAEWRIHGGALIARLEGVTDRTAAEALKGLEIAIPREQLPQAGENEYYWTDLIGLRVTNLAGEALGEVTEVLGTGANDVLVVRDAGRQRLIPFVDPVVRDVQVAGGTMVVDWGADY
ncbi:MAG: ribosome maturation factor RimM [Betaproteobacteria bacterium]|nr:ribosome maturation factor RimM [Betaproteobacteria bacterium]MDE2621619.1 ribosome maturation factor RimM [Betaproteobacteria bacterium]